MEEIRGQKPKLRVIKGGLVSAMLFGGLQIAASPKEYPPFPVDAFVYEEDTFLVLSADPTPRDVKVPMARIMTRLIETQPQAPGSILIRGIVPLRLLAVVHDLNQDPSWKEEWIEKALEGVFQEAEGRSLSAVALPLLGTVHGTLESGRSVALLAAVLGRTAPRRLKRIWLMVQKGKAKKVIDELKARLNP